MKSFRHNLRGVLVGCLALMCLAAIPVLSQEKQEPGQEAAPAAPVAKPTGPKAGATPSAAVMEQRDLQTAIERAGNDRATLMRNLLDYLKKYPESTQRPQIYRAIVESSMQLRDFATASEYAERMVALNPGDISINVLSVQLIERYGDSAGWRRATNYCTRVLEIIQRESVNEKSPRLSGEQFEKDKQHDAAAILLVRGRLFQKLNEPQNAQRDFEQSYLLAPGAPAAERLGELAELRKDLPTAIHQYALAFALADGRPNSVSRTDARKKLGNVWRLAHGSEDGLGDYALRTYDEAAAAGSTRQVRNRGVKDPSEFVLRKVADGTPFPLASTKGKVLVMNFWATWCGPCREWEPHFEKVADQLAGQEPDVVFLQVNCDEDETLVGPYLAEEKPKTSVLFADGLDVLLQVNSFPTTLILDRSGKIAYRAEGFDPAWLDQTLIDAINRTLHPVEGAAPAGANASQ